MENNTKISYIYVLKKYKKLFLTIIGLIIFCFLTSDIFYLDCDGEYCTETKTTILFPINENINYFKQDEIEKYNFVETMHRNHMQKRGSTSKQHKKYDLILITNDGRVINTSQGQCKNTDKLETLAKDIMQKKKIKKISWQ